MDEDFRALKYRAWHRGTREADMMIGGFFDAHHQQWSSSEREWFANLLNEVDVDIMAWAIGIEPAPERYRGTLLSAFQQLDFIRIAK